MKKLHLLMVLAVVILSLQFIWLQKNTAPIDIEGMDYIHYTMQASHAFGGNSIGLFLVSGARAPLPAYLGSLFIIFKNLDTLIFLSSFVYLVILTASVYGISKIAYNEKVAFIASTLLLVSNGIFFIFHAFFPDFSLAAFIALSIYLLLKSDGFRNRKYSTLAGICAGFGWLTKWQFVLYLIPIIGYIFFQNKKLFEPLKEEKQFFKYLIISLGALLITVFSFSSFNRSPFAAPLSVLAFAVVYIILRLILKEKSSLSNMFDFGVSQFVIAGVWYLFQNNRIIEAIFYFTKSSHSVLFRVGSLFSLVNLSYYLRKLIFEHLSIYILSISILAIIFVIVRIFTKRGIKKWNKYDSLFLITFAFIYLIFTYVENKDPRHIFPIIAVVFPLLGSLLYSAFSKKLLNVFLTVIVAISILNIASMVFPISPIFHQVNFAFESPHWWIKENPLEAEYFSSEVLLVINTSRKNNICLLEYKEGLTKSDFQWTEFKEGVQPQKYHVYNLVEDDVFLTLIKCDYLVTKPNDPGWPEGTIKLREFYGELEKNQSLKLKFDSMFKPIAEIKNRIKTGDFVKVYGAI